MACFHEQSLLAPTIWKVGHDWTLGLGKFGASPIADDECLRNKLAALGPQFGGAIPGQRSLGRSPTGHLERLTSGIDGGRGGVVYPTFRQGVVVPSSPSSPSWSVKPFQQLIRTPSLGSLNKISLHPASAPRVHCAASAYSGSDNLGAAESRWKQLPYSSLLVWALKAWVEFLKGRPGYGMWEVLGPSPRSATESVDEVGRAFIPRSRITRSILNSLLPSLLVPVEAGSISALGTSIRLFERGTYTRPLPVLQSTLSYIITPHEYSTVCYSPAYILTSPTHILTKQAGGAPVVLT